MMSMFSKGQKVWIVEPHESFNGDAFFPGEDLYIVTPPGTAYVGGKTVQETTCRVRCPASGADAWIKEDLLVAVPSTGWVRALQKSRAEADKNSREKARLQADLDALHSLIQTVIHGHVGDDYLRKQYEFMHPSQEPQF